MTRVMMIVLYRKSHRKDSSLFLAQRSVPSAPPDSAPQENPCGRCSIRRHVRMSKRP